MGLESFEKLHANTRPQKVRGKIRFDSMLFCSLVASMMLMSMGFRKTVPDRV
jgi:hypothetical protein